MLLPALGPRKLVVFIALAALCFLVFTLRSPLYSDYRHATPPPDLQDSLHDPPLQRPPVHLVESEDKDSWNKKPLYSFPSHSEKPEPTSKTSKPSASADNDSASPNASTTSWHLFDKFAPEGQSTLNYAVKLQPVSNIRMYLDKMLQWARPEPDVSHWPPYQDYIGRDYDPNRWEAFPAEQGFYTKGVKTLRQAKHTQPYLPYPDYNSPEWREEFKGEYVACQGPRGKPMNESKLDQVMAYPELPHGFPKPSVGSLEALGLDSNICFDRYGRYGAYGFGADEYDLPDWEPIQEAQVIWRNVNWGKLQNQCVQRNAQRFAPHARTAETDLKPGIDIPETQLDTATTELSRRQHARDVAVAKSASGSGPSSAEVARTYSPRTAILIRTWEGYTYTDNDLQAIRAMISETSLLSGGEYQVFLFVNVKDRTVPILEDDQAYEDMLKKVVPTELRSISILWNEDICKKAYPEVTDWQVYWHQFMPVQWFSKTHPEFDFIWNWETDARYTGQHYHFLSKIGDFAKRQPRKYLWERNKRYYIPGLHGNWEQYFQDTNAAVESAYLSGALAQQPVWGPQPYSPTQTPLGPSPPHDMLTDQYEWGANEDADLITLLPMFDPVNTFWSYRDKIWNFIPGLHPDFSDDPYDNDYTDERFRTIPRRIFINTVARFSKKMLHTMHTENKIGRCMQAEMWPATVALQHGLKAVYAPQPVWFDRRWPAHYTDAIFNALLDQPNNPIGWSEGPDSPYNGDREHNFYGWSWYFSSRFPKDLYRRWLGWKVKVHEWGEPERVVGGLEEEHGLGERVEKQDESENRDEQKPVVGGRMCLPGMLLHPVKRIQQGEI